MGDEYKLLVRKHTCCCKSCLLGDFENCDIKVKNIKFIRVIMGCGGGGCTFMFNRAQLSTVEPCIVTFLGRLSVLCLEVGDLIDILNKMPALVHLDI